MRILFTGGGTAGHVTPNIALIKRLLAEGWQVDYVGSKTGIERELIAGVPGVTYHAISSGKLRRYFSWQNFADPFRIVRGVFEARRLIRACKPDVIFSKGGYVSVPVVVAAGKTPVVAHESDFSPGLANRIAARYADRVCVTFADTARHISGGRAVHTGTPIRPELYGGDRDRALAFTGLSGDKPVLLVMGGSSGAQRLNELVRGALARLLPSFDVIHLCGRGKVDAAAARPGYVQYEYIDRELPDLLALADIVLSRAGANAVFEFLALAKPAVLVPLPLSASRGDQIQNAKYFEKKGYAVMVDQDTATPDTVADAVAHLYENRLVYHARMTGDAMLDGTDEVLREIREAAAGHRANGR
jgi:UDP-N-acetylglucosamine--N-acetylmuramyl-(pentapeptide) pyrophosphoryl-undecaprenol N-acetylglucosamine transferase